MGAWYQSIKSHFPNSFKTALRLLCDNISLSVIIYIRLYNIFVECWIFMVPDTVLVFLWAWYGAVRARPTSIVFERFCSISARKFHHMLVQFDSFWSNIYSLCCIRFPSFSVFLLICRNFKLKILNILNECTDEYWRILKKYWIYCLKNFDGNIIPKAIHFAITSRFDLHN